MNAQDPKLSGSLLVVDDSPSSLELLVRMLRKQGFKVGLATSGELALEAARQEPPDLILLDIDMPGMNGYEVCQRLKTDAALKAIPVIFLSGLDDVIDKVKAFGVGGVDYVAKPFQYGEVEVRVRTHLALRRQEQLLEENYAQLKELERLRDHLIHMVVHDMRSPLSTIMMALEMAQQTPAPGPAMLGRLLQTALSAASGLKEITTQLLDISRLQVGQMLLNKEPGDLASTLRHAIDSVAAVARDRKLQLDASASCLATYDQDVLSRVVINLLINAMKFTPPEGEIKLTVARHGKSVRVEVTCPDHGATTTSHQRIFGKSGQVELRDKRVGTSLGLTFCRLAVEAHGGQIGVKREPEHFSTFWFAIPAGGTE